MVLTSKETVVSGLAKIRSEHMWLPVGQPWLRVDAPESCSDLQGSPRPAWPPASSRGPRPEAARQAGQAGAAVRLCPRTSRPRAVPASPRQTAVCRGFGRKWERDFAAREAQLCWPQLRVRGGSGHGALSCRRPSPTGFRRSDKKVIAAKEQSASNPGPPKLRAVAAGSACVDGRAWTGPPGRPGKDELQGGKFFLDEVFAKVSVIRFIHCQPALSAEGLRKDVLGLGRD